MSNEKPSDVVMLQNEGFVAPNKRTPHIKPKKKKKKAQKKPTA